ncbi:tripartite motif-containing protein 46-like [Myxocyprinus asiaticus]|uniref:tripartite motif-containing protein 46-like n=1 Tax=Myxocyprinus asiaticus TaxID=70543 RepID=UPI00222305F4|nr:tripartite motif-containing protein 46-like [Myxocyprinus asiaticus]XP_051574719.1 tripartite motif-containing protein 46-like [Myxocyprinus asiaticus]XP_051574720.1 tripartite motif-containing protein 46-like [Myxocyprinus asiaticus]
MADAELQTFTSIMDTLVRISSNMKSIERELHCPVCEEMVKQPIVLPCLHSVCVLCAAEVLVQRGYPQPELPPEPNTPTSSPNMRSPRQTRRPPPKTDRLDRVIRTVCGTHPGRRRKDTPPVIMLFPCPTCGKDVELGERGLADCLRNLTLERIVERYRQTVSLGSMAVMCQFCKPPQALEATKGCADCRSNFCNECFKLYHPWGTPRAQHEHILPTHSFRPKVLVCVEHEHEKLQFYCRSCQQLLCPLCKLRRAHSGHKIMPIALAYQTLKEKITKEMNYILANQDAVQAQITQVESGIAQTEVNSAVAKEQLNQCVSELRGVLAERQGALAMSLEGARAQRAGVLNAQLSEKQSLMENAGLITYTQELLKETDQPCFVQAARVTHNRLVKAIEHIQHFSLSADPSFRHFQLDASRELKAFSSMNFIQAPLAPVIDTQKTLAYDQLYLCWRLPQDSAPAWHYSVEYQRKVGGSGALWGRVRSEGGPGTNGTHCPWQRLDDVGGTSAVIDKLEMDSVYVLRVRGCNKAGFGEYSEEVYLHTPPAPVLSFCLDSRWGLHAERVALGKGQTYARSVPGLTLLQAADRALTSCHLTSDLLVADVSITQGRHYWACSVEPGSYLVKVGVGLEAKLQEWFHLPQDMASPRYDPDSGHDSGAEDAQDCPPPFCFLTMGMGKILLPKCGASNSSTGPLTAPLPPRLGLCLDFEKGRLTFYDAHSLRVLWEGTVDCSAPVCPAFCFIGGGALQLQELIANRTVEQNPPRRVTIQTRPTDLTH